MEYLCTFLAFQRFRTLSPRFLVKILGLGVSEKGSGTINSYDLIFINYKK